MKAPLERDIQRQCLDWLKLAGVFAWRNNSGAVSAAATETTARRFIRFGGMPGASDILGVLPGGRLLAAEIKRPGNHPTEAQRAFLDAVSRAGGLSLVIHSLDELRAALAMEGVTCG